MRKPTTSKNLLGILFFFFVMLSHGNALQLIDLQNLQITKKNPATFVIYSLAEGDFLDIGFQVTNGNPQDLTIEIISVNSAEPEVIRNVRRSGEQFQVPEDGNYHIRFSAEDDVWITLNISRISNYEPESGEIARFKFDAKISDTRESGEYLKLYFDLEAGDEILFSSSDGKSTAITVNFIQGSRQASVGSGPQFTAERYDRYTFHLFLNREDPNLKEKFIQKIFGKKDLQFQDINITVNRPYVPKSNPGASQGAITEQGDEDSSDGGVSDMLSMMEDQRKAREAEQERLMQQMEAGQLSQAESQKMMFEFFRKQEEDAKKAEEERMRRMSRAILDISAQEEIPVPMTLMPKNDFFGRASRHTQCELLSLPNFDPDVHSGNWFFMIYVGQKEIMDSIMEFELEPKLKTAKKIWDQEAINYHRANNFRSSDANWTYDRESKQRKISWPTPRSHPDLFGEDISYAIIQGQFVDDYLNGKRVPTYISKNNVSIDRGLLGLPSNTEVYLCATNNNLNTPVDIIFYYSVIEALNLNEDSY